jgi:hypothetical protein
MEHHVSDRWINDLNSTVKSKGKTTVVFNGFEHLSAPQVAVASDVAVMVWEGDGTASNLSAYDKIVIGPVDKLFLTPNNYHNLYPDQAWLYDAWTPDSSAKTLGFGMPTWNDYNPNAEEQYLEDEARLPRAVVADRTWNATPTPDSIGQFQTRVNAIGAPTNSVAIPTTARVNDAQPSHHYRFDDTPYPPSHHYASAPGQALWVADDAGGLSGSTYIIHNPTIVSGKKGQAFHFVNPGDGVEFGGADVAAPWTYSTWVKRNADHPDATLLASRAGAIKLEQFQTAARVGFTKFGVADYSFAYTVPLGAWVNLTFVATPTATTLYVNGAQQGTVNASIALPMRSIGRAGQGLVGDLDEMSTYDEALTAPQVQTLYDSVANPAPTPIRQWSFNEGAGTSTVEAIGGGSATLVNGVQWVPGQQGGYAVSLDGVDDQVNLGLADYAGDWTVNARVKRTGDRASSVLLASQSAAVKLEQWNNTHKIGVTKYGISDTGSAYSPPLNTWIRLTLVSTGGQILVYSNGIQVGTVATTASLPLSWLGRRGTSSPSDAAAMVVDDITVYGSALTAAQVQTLP